MGERPGGERGRYERGEDVTLTLPHRESEGLVEEDVTSHHQAMSLNIMNQPSLKVVSHAQMDAPACLAVQLPLKRRRSQVLNHATPNLDKREIRPFAPKDSDERRLGAWQGLRRENVADEGDEGEGERPSGGREARVHENTGKMLLQGAVHPLSKPILSQVSRDRRLLMNPQLKEPLLHGNGSKLPTIITT